MKGSFRFLLDTGKKREKNVLGSDRLKFPCAAFRRRYVWLYVLALSIWFTLQLSWTRRSGRTSNNGARLGRHLILGMLLLLLLFLTRSVVGNGVTNIDSSRCGGLNIGNGQMN